MCCPQKPVFIVARDVAFLFANLPSIIHSINIGVAGCESLAQGPPCTSESEAFGYPAKTSLQNKMQVFTRSTVLCECLLALFIVFV